MPTAMIQNYAKRAGVTVGQAETQWEKAKEIAFQRLKSKEGPKYWAYVNAITQKLLHLKEDSPTLKQFMDDIHMSMELPAPEAPMASAEPEMPASVAPMDAAVSSAEVPAAAPPSNMSCLVSMLFGARDWAHMLHLKTQSHAAHLALEELYNELVEHADKMAETSQGKHGLLNVLADQSSFAGLDECGFVCKLACWLECEGRQAICPTDTYLLNQLDEVIATVYRTKYKLENLK